MTKTLTPMGDSLGLILDKPLLEMMHLGADTPLDVETDGEVLIIRRAQDTDRRSRVRKATEKMMDAHAQTLRKLAK